MPPQAPPARCACRHTRYFFFFARFEGRRYFTPLSLIMLYLPLSAFAHAVTLRVAYRELMARRDDDTRSSQQRREPCYRFLRDAREIASAICAQEAREGSYSEARRVLPCAARRVSVRGAPPRGVYRVRVLKRECAAFRMLLSCVLQYVFATMFSVLQRGEAAAARDDDHATLICYYIYDERAHVLLRCQLPLMP